MAYILGQYNKNINTSNNGFMRQITTGTASRRQVLSDNGVTGANSEPFEDECCTGLSLISSKKYYFHCKIKRHTDFPLIFTVKLVNYEAGTENIEQYLKTITVQSGDLDDEWADFEIIFTPLISFDTILFELQRISVDYKVEVRYPKFVYIELSEILNAIDEPSAINLNNKEFIKIGVQSRPGLMMCINGEEIHTSRSGIYELKNGDILVNFFSVVTAAKENNEDEDNPSTVNGAIKKINDEYAASTTEAEREAIQSRCMFATSKNRIIDSFTLDYVYKEMEV